MLHVPECIKATPCPTGDANEGEVETKLVTEQEYRRHESRGFPPPILQTHNRTRSGKGIPAAEVHLVSLDDAGRGVLQSPHHTREHSRAHLCVERVQILPCYVCCFPPRIEDKKAASSAVHGGNF